jgi:hypothetical protein
VTPRGKKEVEPSLGIRRAIATFYGAPCHAFSAVALATMIAVTGSKMNWGPGTIPAFRPLGRR